MAFFSDPEWDQLVLSHTEPQDGAVQTPSPGPETQRFEAEDKGVPEARRESFSDKNSEKNTATGDTPRVPAAGAIGYACSDGGYTEGDDIGNGDENEDSSEETTPGIAVDFRSTHDATAEVDALLSQLAHVMRRGVCNGPPSPSFSSSPSSSPSFSPSLSPTCHSPLLRRWRDITCRRLDQHPGGSLLPLSANQRHAHRHSTPRPQPHSRAPSCLLAAALPAPTVTTCRLAWPPPALYPALSLAPAARQPQGCAPPAHRSGQRPDKRCGRGDGGLRHARGRRVGGH